jgi:hypothetical protein
MNNVNNKEFLFEDYDLTDEENLELNEYIRSGCSSCPSTARRYVDFITQYGDILFAHIEVDFCDYHLADRYKRSWVIDFQDELNRLLEKRYPEVDLPIIDYGPLFSIEGIEDQIAADKMMVNLVPLSQNSPNYKFPILHILVGVKPLALLKIKDDLLYILSTFEDPSGEGLCKMKIEQITSSSSIYKMLKPNCTH